jgi:holo-[acyl-carrier protein] synthase
VNRHITTGIDVIEIERIKSARERWGNRFLNRIYTPKELVYCLAKNERLAGRFAAKEAVSKALGVGIRALRWKDIEVLRGEGGKPHVFLHGKAAKIANTQGIAGLDVSITHSRSEAIAFVVAWRETLS